MCNFNILQYLRKYYTVRAPLYPKACIFFTPFLKTISLFSRRFFQKILSLCMVSIQERFLIKSAYVIWFEITHLDSSWIWVFFVEFQTWTRIALFVKSNLGALVFNFMEPTKKIWLQWCPDYWKAYLTPIWCTIWLILDPKLNQRLRLQLHNKIISSFI